MRFRKLLTSNVWTCSRVRRSRCSHSRLAASARPEYARTTARSSPEAEATSSGSTASISRSTEALRAHGGEPRSPISSQHLEPAVDALADHHLEPAAAVQRHRVRRHPHQRPHDLEVELAFGAEVVVQQAPGDAGLERDVRCRDRRVRALGEQLAGDHEDLAPALVVLESLPPGRRVRGHRAREASKIGRAPIGADGPSPGRAVKRATTDRQALLAARQQSR